MTATAIAGTQPASREIKPVYRVTWTGVLKSEWAKLWSLRSTWICVVIALASMLGLGAAAAVQYRAAIGAGDQALQDLAVSDAVSLSLFAVSIAQLVLGVLGVLISAGEFSTGSIRATLTAVPRRLPVLAAKGGICLAVSFVVGLIGAFGSFAITGAIISGTQLSMSLTAPGVMRALVGSALYMAFVAVISLAFGFLLRSVAGGISALVVLVFLLPGLLSLLPAHMVSTISPYLPSSAGGSMYALRQVSGTLSPGMGTLVVLIWTAVVVGAASWQLMRSDT